VSLAEIRALYDEAKEGCWDPQRDVPWERFDPSAHQPDALAAAALAWSRRAWVEYTGLAETPSALVRFCIERGREADPKLFLTVRNTEEAWHIECCHRYAQGCGGYVEAPASPRYAALLERGFHREVLNAETSLDAYFAAHALVGDGLELALWEGYLANAEEPVARSLLEHAVADKRRHAAFGERYVAARAPGWSDAQRSLIGEYVERYVREVELAGYHAVSLGPEADVADLVAAERLAAAAGLGALAPEAERSVASASITRSLAALAADGIPLRPIVDPRLPA
jgi:hypothetical protein